MTETVDAGEIQTWLGRLAEEQPELHGRWLDLRASDDKRVPPDLVETLPSDKRPPPPDDPGHWVTWGSAFAINPDDPDVTYKPTDELWHVLGIEHRRVRRSMP